MNQNTSGAGNSAVASTNLRCTLAHSDCFWIRLVPDRQTPGLLVGKDWDGKTCLFSKETRVPREWEADQFALVTEVLAKEKFRVVSLVDYRCEDDTAPHAVRVCFCGTLRQSFPEASDNLVIEYLDQLTHDILVSDKLSQVLEQEAQRQAAELARVEKEQADAAARVEARAAAMEGLSPQAVLWVSKWEAIDWTAHYSDDSMCERRAAWAKAKLQVIGLRKLTPEDREKLKALNWAAIAQFAHAPTFDGTGGMTPAALLLDGCSPAGRELGNLLALMTYRRREADEQMKQVIWAAAKITDVAELGKILAFPWVSVSHDAAAAVMQLRSLGKGRRS